MKIRVALLGVAHVHAHGYAARLGGYPDVELLGFSEENSQTAREFAHSSGLEHRSLEELLNLKPHGVVVCSENARRLGPVQAAAAAGAHVLCEKPIATNELDARAMKAACDTAGVQFVTAFPARFSSAVQTLRARLDAGQLGKVLTYSGVNHSVAPDREAPWFSDLALAGGGAGMDHIVHLADLLRYLGEQPLEVYACLRPVPEWVRPRPEPVQSHTDAAGLVTLKLASGSSATIDCSWSRPPGYPRWGHLKLGVTGTQGMVGLDVFAQNLHSSGQTYRWEGYGEDLNATMLEDFLRVCREGTPGQATWEDGFEALRVVKAAYASSERGQPVALEGEL